MPLQPPIDLAPRGREAFSNAIATLKAIGEDPELYGEAIIRYARACDDEETARQAWTLDGCPMHSVGSTGALVAHPLSKAVRDAQAHAAKIGDSLGLSPEARAKMGRTGGRPQGVSTAPDRKLRRAA